MREVAYVKGLWLIFYFTDCHRQSYRQWLVRIFNSWYHNKNHTASDCSCLSTGPARWDLADDRLLCHERQCDCKRELWTQFGQTTGMFQLNCCKLTLTYGERARWTAKWPRISFFFSFRKSSGEQFDSMMRWVYSLKHHTWRHTCGRNKKSGAQGAAWCLWRSYHILTSSVIYYWTDPRQYGIIFDVLCNKEAKLSAFPPIHHK